MSNNAGPRTMLAFSAAAFGAVAGRLLSRRRARYSFRGRVVLLTGATRGLGLAMARHLVAEGARVWLLARSEDALRAAVSELEGRGGRVHAIRADVRDAQAIEQAVYDIVSVTGRIDVLINNAGVITVAPFEHTHLEDFSESLATCFWGPLRLIRAALPYMTCDGSGRIINISSIGGRIGVPHLSAYAAGKFALVGLSETLRAELKSEGILVTTVTPGLMRTGSYITAKLRGQHREEARWFSLSSASPLSAMSASRAAKQILEASRQGRATFTPGWKARVAHIAAAVTPELTASVAAFAAGHVLPRPTSAAEADQVRPANEVAPGWIRLFLPERTRRRYHQPQMTSP